MEGNRFEREKPLADFTHGFDVILETCRGALHAQEAVGGDDNWGPEGLHIVTDTGDDGEYLCALNADPNCVGLGSSTWIADINIVTARGEIDTGIKPQGDVAAADGIARERSNTDGRVADAGCVGIERYITDGRVVSSGVAEKREGTDGCTAIGGGIGKERSIADGRIVDAGGIAKQRERSISRILVGGGVIQKSSSADSRIFGRGVGKKCPSANGCVEAAGGVAPEREVTNSRVKATGGEALKSLLPFSRVASGIAAIRRRSDRFCFESDSRETEKREE
jgi:hypothetical protein